MVPLVHVNTIADWEPEAGHTADRRGKATVKIGRRLPAAVSLAVNKIDRRTGDRVIREEQVRVDFGETSRFTVNGSPMQIIVNPSLGGLEYGSPEERQRRCNIRDLIEKQLQGLFREFPDVEFPEYDLEIIPMEMSGHSSGPNGVTGPGWGNPILVED
jgi:hypothetical protein